MKTARSAVQMLAGVALACAGCGGSPAENTADDAPAIATLDVSGDDFAAPEEALGGVVWQHPGDPSRRLLIGAAGAGGLVLRGIADGAAYPGIDHIQPDLIALAPAVGGGPHDGALIVASDRGSAELWMFRVEPDGPALRVAHVAPLRAETEVTGLCAYRSAASGRHYVFVAGGDGLLQQWEVWAGARGVGGRLVRKVALGGGIGACAADEPAGAVYVADESVGIWRVGAEPEDDPADRRLVDATAPRGHARGEVNGLAVSGGVLLALLDEGEAINAYALPSGRYLGSAALQVGQGEVALGEIEGLWADGQGLIVLPDAGKGGGPRWRLVPWARLAEALPLPPARFPDPLHPAPPAARIVEPTVETEPVTDYGDAADDIAIWVHPHDPSQSLIVGAQKKRGIELYDLKGRRLQLLPDGRMNNVDLRQGVRIGERRLDVIAASNRTLRAISLYTLDLASRRLEPLGAPVSTGLADPYGLCMYVSGRDGAVYVFVNNSDRGEFQQWRLQAQGAGIGARRVREFVVGSQAEGCVADDATGALYVAEEDQGLWRYAAEPDGGDARVRIDATGEGGNLTADVEGLAIFHGPGTSGYLVVSNQGANDYAVYRRDGDNAFIGRFIIGPNDALGIDGVSETDGLEVTSRSLGPAFPHGLLVVQDGRNITPTRPQNFKLVPWERVAGALQLSDP